MKELFRQYIVSIVSLYQDVPTDVYDGLLSISYIGAVVLIAFLGWKRGRKKVAGLLLAEYIFLIYCSTVICRTEAEGVPGYNPSPFWSYEAIKNGREDLVAENIMNVLVFVPIGLLLGLITQKTLNGWRTLIARVLLIVVVGMIMSGSIEMLQYFLKRGFSEFDDVFHNTLGCLGGLMIIMLIERKWLLLKRY